MSNAPAPTTADKITAAISTTATLVAYRRLPADLDRLAIVVKGADGWYWGGTFDEATGKCSNSEALVRNPTRDYLARYLESRATA